MYEYPHEISGTYAEEKGISTCKKCKINTYASSTKQSQCKGCPLGYTTGEDGIGSARCMRCAAGRYGEMNKETVQCSKCPTGWKRSEDDTNLTACILCGNGETSTIEGATACTVTHSVAKDCDYINQYLNNSSPNKNDWVIFYECCFFFFLIHC